MSKAPDQEPLPFNMDLEQALIGAMLVNNDAYSKVSSIVTADSFFEPIHAQIWRVSAQMIEAGKLVTPITLKSYLGDAELAPGVTVMTYLARLAGAATTVLNAPDYAKGVRDLFIQRRIVGIAEAAKSLAREIPADMNVMDLISDFNRDLDSLIPMSGGESDNLTSFGTIDMSEVSQAHMGQGGVAGRNSGFPRLDELDNILVDTNLVVLAGRPAMGKTALATSIGVHIAREEQAIRREGGKPRPVAFFSLEMSSKQLKQRVLSDLSGVIGRRLMRGEAENSEMEAFMLAERENRDLPLYIDQTGEMTIAQLRTKARRFKKLHGMSLLIVDYIQLLKGSSKKDQNRTGEVTEITTGLKALAKELEVPIIALSQLSRDVEKRDDKRPMLADLRESGSIEQDADVVIFVYREEYYLKRQEPREDGEALIQWQARMEKWKGVAEIIVGKNRHGEVGTAELGWDGRYTRFNPEPPYRAPDAEDARQAKRLNPLTDHGQALKDIMMELSTLAGRRPTAEDMAHKATLHAHAQLINRDEVRRLFFERVVVDLPNDQRAKRLQAAADNLRRAQQTATYTDSNGQNFVYLIELLPGT